MTQEEAIKWITNLSDDIGAMRHQELWHYRQALDEIKDILECDYFADWIPCSEHLPEEGDLVLLWDADRFPSKKYVLCEFREKYGFYNWNEGTFIAEYDGANAWMPLPEPYTEE